MFYHRIVSSMYKDVLSTAYLGIIHPYTLYGIIYFGKTLLKLKLPPWISILQKSEIRAILVLRFRHTFRGAFVSDRLYTLNCYFLFHIYFSDFRYFNLCQSHIRMKYARGIQSTMSRIDLKFLTSCLLRQEIGYTIKTSIDMLLMRILFGLKEN